MIRLDVGGVEVWGSWSLEKGTETLLEIPECLKARYSLLPLFRFILRFSNLEILDSKLRLFLGGVNWIGNGGGPG